MADGTNTGMKAAGGGCSACGCLLVLVGLVLAGLVAGGAFNYSVEDQALGGAGSSVCCGSFALMVGIVLLLVGMRSGKTDDLSQV